MPSNDLNQGGSKRGRLKVYLGMAAGVGKTFSMLSDARLDIERGNEVVIGYLQSHGRKETEDLAIGMEQIPLAEISHRGVKVREFDLDAALKRRPQFLLVDELAHTNAEGSRHIKRWQDVAELLENGINVRTTVNIQHLESVRDVVAQITGVFVQETVPDLFFDFADEVELVDIPPEELHKRLEEGKVYGAEKIDQALTGFFKKSNLLALRELALRHTADRVDEEMRASRALQEVRQPWHARERILVCLAPNRMAARVVRAAKMLSTNLHADMIAVSVESSRQSGVSEQDRAHLAEAMVLAESLGAKTAFLAGEDIVAEVLRYAESENVTTIVMGKPVRKRLSELVFGSVTDQMIRQSGDIDVLIITGPEEHGTALNPIRRSARPKEPISWRGYAVTVGIIALCTAVGFLMIDRFELANIVMIYILGVAIVSVRFGRNESLLASVLGVAAFDFSFVHPRGTFNVSDLQYLLTFAVMLVVSLLISSLTQQLKEQTKSVSKRARETAALYEVSSQLASSRKRSDMATVAVTKVANVSGCAVAVFLPDSMGQLDLVSSSNPRFEVSHRELAVVQWAFENGKPAGKGTDTLAGASSMYLPLDGSTDCLGVLGLQPTGHQVIEASNRHLVEAIAHQLALALDRIQHAQDSHEASLMVEREKLRGNLLSSVSHDLRTPLASIEGAASSLAEQADLNPRARTLAITIQEESERMARLVRNLLDMSRFEGGGVELSLDWQSIEELSGSAVLRTDQLFTNPVRVRLDQSLPLLKLDGVLVEQVFVNLLENAARHGGQNVQVVISGRLVKGVVQITVANDGPGLPEGESDRLFEKFRKRGGDGFGLGLAICRAVMVAHQGSISAQNGLNGGVEFLLEFPMSSLQEKA
jgi:two-component system sensor histidine kinase KdpD